MILDEDHIELIDLLKTAYMAEIETSINYLAHSINLTGFNGEIVRQILAEEAKEEMGHAGKIGKRLRILGSAAPGSNFLRSQVISAGQIDLQPPAENWQIDSVLGGICKAEKEAIVLYKQIIELAMKLNDYSTADMATELLADEEQHLDLFQGFLR